MSGDYTMYFSLKELSSPDGVGGDVRREVRKELHNMRAKYGHPIIVNSGRRSPAHNRRVGGAPNSYHLTGLAVDIRLPTDPDFRDWLLQCSFKFDWSGRGFYSTFIHLDMRHLNNTNRAYWVG